MTNRQRKKYDLSSVPIELIKNKNQKNDVLIFNNQNDF